VNKCECRARALRWGGSGGSGGHVCVCDCPFLRGVCAGAVGVRTVSYPKSGKKHARLLKCNGFLMPGTNCSARLPASVDQEIRRGCWLGRAVHVNVATGMFTKNVACGAHQRGGSAVPLDNPDRRSSRVHKAPDDLSVEECGIRLYEIGRTFRAVNGLKSGISRDMWDTSN
jgi:hypothetical protein